MKAYKIKNVDGSDFPRFKNVYFYSREDAFDSLRCYIECKNRELNGDSPLSCFVIEEREVNETILDLNSARIVLGLKANTGFTVAEKKYSTDDIRLRDINRLITDINPKYIESLIALNELFTIADAWNKMDEFVPDFRDMKQEKYFPWFTYDDDAAKFVFAGTTRNPSTVSMSVGARICFKTKERAIHFGTEFEHLFSEYFSKGYFNLK